MFFSQQNDACCISFEKVWGPDFIKVSDRLSVCPSVPLSLCASVRPAVRLSVYSSVVTLGQEFNLLYNYDVFRTCNTWFESTWEVLQYGANVFRNSNIIFLLVIFHTKFDYFMSLHTLLKLLWHDIHHRKRIVEYNIKTKSFRDIRVLKLVKYDFWSMPISLNKIYLHQLFLIYHRFEFRIYLKIKNACLLFASPRIVLQTQTHEIHS